MIESSSTSPSAIAAEFVRSRRRAGSPAMGMIMTLVIVADRADADVAMTTARSASREHPARILVVVNGDRRGNGQVDAQVGIGSGASGERAIIRLSGEVTRHAESVVLPLLLPDSPVVVWWPGQAPADPAADPSRAAQHPADHRRRLGAVLQQGEGDAHPVRDYSPGNTDLAWTRITGWRALLATALDQNLAKVVSASVEAERISPSADLLSAWLGDRLRCDVTRKNSKGPGITAGRAAYQGGRHLADSRGGRPAGHPSLPQRTRPAGRAQAPRARRAALRGAAPARPRRRLRRDGQGDGQDRLHAGTHPEEGLDMERPRDRDRDLPLRRRAGGSHRGTAPSSGWAAIQAAGRHSGWSD